MSGGPINPYSGVSPVARVAFQFWRQPVYVLADGTYWNPGSDGPTYLNQVGNAWDYLYLGIPSTNPYTPGKATVHVTKFRDIDKKKAAGNDGGRVTIHGVEPCLVEIEIEIWTPEQLRQLAALWPTLFPQAYKGAPPAYDAQHPLLTFHGIKSLQFVKGDGPEVDSQGRGTFRMSAWEFLKPGKTNVTKTNVAAIGSLLDPGAVGTTPSGLALPGANSSNLGPR